MGGTAWAEVPGAPFVEAQHDGTGGAGAVELLNQFFLMSKSGSDDVFHVRMRCGVSPSRRSRRRIHSSVTGGSRRRERQYSPSFGTDQLENGKPRSWGLDTSKEQLLWSAAPPSARARPAAAQLLAPFLLGLAPATQPASFARHAEHAVRADADHIIVDHRVGQSSVAFQLIELLKV